MRSRLPLVVLLAGACAVIASLYLPWLTAPARSCGKGCVQGAYTADGWLSDLGDAAALVGIALVTMAAAALVRPTRTRRLPLARCSLGLGYSVLAIALAIRAQEGFLRTASYGQGLQLQWAYGTWLGVAGAGLAVGAVAAIRSRDLPPRPSASTLVWLLLGLGLLASFLLPWYRVAAVYTLPGIPAATATVAVLAVFVAGKSSTGRLGIAAVAALLTGAAFSGYAAAAVAPHAYGAWLALGFALALLGLAVVAARAELRRPPLPAGIWAVGGAATLFVASLFLHWQTLCVPNAAAGQRNCFTANGWTLPNTAAAMLALLVVAAPVLRRLRISRAELAAGAALLVATAGFGVGGAPLEMHYAYGSIVGFVAAAALLVLTLGRLRLPPLDRTRPVRLVPVTASVLFMLGVLLPWWSVLPSGWESESGVLTGWLAVAGLLLSLHLLASWLARTDSSAARDETLMLAPVTLLGLVVLDIVRDRYLGLTWGGGILMALCLLLLALGWLERRQGLEHVRPPELLRLDRLPGAEA